MDLNKLKGHIPDIVGLQIPEVATRFQINTPLRLSHFLAQCAHESGNFRLVQENLNYSAKGLLTVFKKYFPDPDIANAYARKPEHIANLVYANRMGNGDKASGDGWRYRGRGFIQLTGKYNYAAFGKIVPENILEQPDLVAVRYPLLSAAWFWGNAGLNTLADRGATDAVVTAVTKKVNGGENGLPDRILHFRHFYSILSS